MERPIGRTKKRGTVAKKPTPRKKTRSRVSGINKAGITDGISAAGGAIAGRFLGNMIVKFFPGTNLYLVNGAVAAGGYLLPKFIKAPFARMAGIGMIAGAAIGAAANLGIISGIGAGNRVMAYQLRNNKPRLNGLDNLSAVNGLDNLSAVNGRPQMRRVAGVPSNVYHSSSVLPVVQRLWNQKYGGAA